MIDQCCSLVEDLVLLLELVHYRLLLRGLPAAALLAQLLHALLLRLLLRLRLELLRVIVYLLLDRTEEKRTEHRWSAPATLHAYTVRWPARCKEAGYLHAAVVLVRVVLGQVVQLVRDLLDGVQHVLLLLRQRLLSPLHLLDLRLQTERKTSRARRSGALAWAC